jgi:hypothetical protein
MSTFAGLYNELITHYQLVVIEALLVVAAIFIALVAPRLGATWYRETERRFSRFARRRVLSILTVGLLALAGRAALLPLMPIPEPGTHDEFSYLLAADTLGSGRLTNPAHPMWKHFESFHILQRPTYMSMYPIAQSVMAGAGKVLFGHPWWGIWLSAGVFCGMLCWMLQGWLPPQWALLGGLIAVVRIGFFSYWMNSYMGGAMAAIGGALVLGALPRIMRRQQVSDALWMGAGIIILANSRPSEGFFTALGAFVVLVAWIVKRRPLISPLLTRVALPMGSLLLVMCIAMGFFFWRVTGNPFQMPYQVNRATYATAPVFFFQTPRAEPHYNHAVMRDFYINWEQALYAKTQSPKGVVVRTLGKFLTLWLFYFGPVLSLPLLMFVRVFHDKRLRLLLIAGAVGVIGILAPAWLNAHYAAPMTGLMYAVMLQGMRHLRACRWRGKETGLFLARSIPLICLLMIPVRLSATSLGWNVKSDWRQTWSYASAGMMDRAALLKRLESTPGTHLVIVRYKPDHDFHSEWVYNEANIDAAKVVWAREMDPANDRELINYFKDRELWLLEADEKPPRLSPYPVAQPTAPLNRSQLK